MSTETTRMRTEAEALIAKATESLSEGEIEKSNSFIDEAEVLHIKADELDEAASRIKLLQADREQLDSTRIEVTPTIDEIPIIAKEVSIQGAKYDPNYRPESYIKSMPAAAQPKHILDVCGENIKARAAAYSNAFRHWMSYSDESSFRLNADPAYVKQMVEGTDADGGYYVPEEFLARNWNLYEGVPGGTLRDFCTTIRVTSKDGYAPSMAALTWAAMTEATAPSAVKPTIGQVAFTLEKSGSLVQISDELLEDEAMNIPDLLAGAARKAAGQFQNRMLLNGTGAWAGVLQSGSIGTHTTANAASIVAADITGTYYDIDADFRDSENAIFVSKSGIASAIAAIGSAAAGIHQLAS